MKNLTELRNELTSLFMSLKEGNIEVKTAAEMNNTAGKLLKSAQLQLEYHRMRQEKPSIPFFSMDKSN